MALFLPGDWKAAEDAGIIPAVAREETGDDSFAIVPLAPDSAERERWVIVDAQTGKAYLGQTPGRWDAPDEPMVRYATLFEGVGDARAVIEALMYAVGRLVK